MKSANKRFVQKAIAVVVIVTLLYGAGVAPVVMLFISGVILVVFLVTRRAQNREVEQVFEFYMAADAILRDEDRRWYGFEVAEVIDQGEELLEGIPDPPPLLLFTLGALHQLVEQHSISAEYLAKVLEDDNSDERYQTAPSSQLRRYVSVLRRIETDPSVAPQTLGAIRSLERMRRKCAHNLLGESRKQLKVVGVRDPQVLEPKLKVAAGQSKFANMSQSVRPPIKEVLNDIYPDDESSH